MWVSATLQHHPRVSTLARFPSVPNKVPETSNLWRRKGYLGLWLGGFSLWFLEPQQSSIAWWKHMMNTAIHTSIPKSEGKKQVPKHFQGHIPLGSAFSTDSHIFNTWAFERHWDLKYNKTMWSLARTWEDQNLKHEVDFYRIKTYSWWGQTIMHWGLSVCIVSKLLRSPAPFTSQYTYLQPPSIP